MACLNSRESEFLVTPAHNVLSHLEFFKVGEIMVSKYGYLMLPGPFLDKVTSDIDFTDGVIVQCSLLCSSCKNTFVGVGNLKVITNEF